ncbi:hypothetical protein [Salipaludibacillus sp. CF4.18]|uniref:hypothetical protein n=1 Tax=Salipaludibacillus sp. CF4.18 TaxID=3373081 RepID=UPI003EE71B60
MAISRSEIRFSSIDRISTSVASKGNQIKWYKNGYWFKANDFGYEDIAEWVASAVLNYSSLDKSMYVDYGLCSATDDDSKRHRSSYSRNLIPKGSELITIHRLLTKSNISIDVIENRKKSTEYKISFIIDKVYTITGIDLTDYLRTLITFDAFILNEDRHLDNIALLHNKNTGFSLCPIFDNGLSLLSDTKDYGYNKPLYVNIANVKSRPFSSDFDKQMKVLGPGLTIDGDGLMRFLDHEKETIGRVYDLLGYQIKKYKGTIVL